MCKQLLTFPLLALSISTAYGATYYVSTATELQNAMKNAAPGDIIEVAPGDYAPGSTSNSGDPGSNPNPDASSFFYVGNDGTAADPILIIGEDPANPPVLKGNGPLNAGYVVHVTGDHVHLKNLKVQDADKGVMYDNADYGIVEDVEIYNVGTEAIHARDGSSNMIVNRSKVSYTGRKFASFGEGFYIGTDYNRWGGTYAGPEAVNAGWGYDWDVQNTQVTCNYFAEEVTAEPLDIKEGTRNTLIQNNVFVGTHIGTKPTNYWYDDSIIDLKGVDITVIDNDFCNCGGNIAKYTSEVKRNKTNVEAAEAAYGMLLTATKHRNPWTDDSADNNNATEANNTIVSSVSDHRASCSEHITYTPVGGSSSNQNGYQDLVDLPNIIEAEHYHTAPVESTPLNQGSGTANCTDYGLGVDVEDNTLGTCIVGWTDQGEQLTYRVGVANDNYDIGLKIASDTANVRVQVDVDGTAVGEVSTLGSGWGNWQVETLENVSIANNAIITLTFLDGDLNIDSLDVTVATPPVDCSFTDSNVYSFANLKSGLIMDPTLGTANDTNVVQSGTSASGDQRRFTAYDMGNGYFSLIGVHSGKALSVHGGSTNNGANVSIKGTVASVANRQFKLENGPNGACKMLPRHTVEAGSSKCITVSGGSTATNANVNQWTCNGNMAQEWTPTNH